MKQEDRDVHTSTPGGAVRIGLVASAVLLASGLALDVVHVPGGSNLVATGLMLLTAMPALIVVTLVFRAARLRDWPVAAAAVAVIALLLLSAFWKSG